MSTARGPAPRRARRLAAMSTARGPAPCRLALLLLLAAHAARAQLETFTVTTLAGGPATGDADGAGTAAAFFAPAGLAPRTRGAAGVLVADAGNNLVRNVSRAGGDVTTFAGGGGAGGAPPRREAGAAEGVGTAALFSGPSGLLVSVARGSVFVCDTANHKIRGLTPDGLSDTLVGGGAGGAEAGAADGTGTAALFDSPSAIGAPQGGAIVVSDAGNSRLRTFGVGSRIVTTLAGGGASGTLAGFADGAGTAALFSSPRGIAIVPLGSDIAIIYVADTGNAALRAVRVFGLPVAQVTTLAGGGAGGGARGAADGAGTNALFFAPAGLALDAASFTLFVADTGGATVRAVSIGAPPAIVETVAGSGVNATADGEGTAASFDAPTAVALAEDGALYVAERAAVRLVVRALQTPSPTVTPSVTPSAPPTPAAAPSPSQSPFSSPPPTPTPSPTPSPSLTPTAAAAAAAPAPGTSVGVAVGASLGAIFVAAAGAAAVVLRVRDRKRRRRPPPPPPRSRFAASGKISDNVLSSPAVLAAVADAAQHAGVGSATAPTSDSAPSSPREAEAAPAAAPDIEAGGNLSGDGGDGDVPTKVPLLVPGGGAARALVPRAAGAPARAALAEDSKFLLGGAAAAPPPLLPARAGAAAAASAALRAPGAAPLEARGPRAGDAEGVKFLLGGAAAAAGDAEGAKFVLGGAVAAAAPPLLPSHPGGSAAAAATSSSPPTLPAQARSPRAGDAEAAKFLLGGAAAAAAARVPALPLFPAHARAAGASAATSSSPPQVLPAQARSPRAGDAEGAKFLLGGGAVAAAPPPAHAGAAAAAAAASPPPPAQLAQARSALAGDAAGAKFVLGGGALPLQSLPAPSAALPAAVPQPGSSATGGEAAKYLLGGERALASPPPLPPAPAGSRRDGEGGPGPDVAFKVAL
jgi:hypothetical protein